MRPDVSYRPRVDRGATSAPGIAIAEMRSRLRPALTGTYDYEPFHTNVLSCAVAKWLMTVAGLCALISHNRAKMALRGAGVAVGASFGAG
jgi:hypothetical protein